MPDPDDDARRLVATHEAGHMAAGHHYGTAASGWIFEGVADSPVGPTYEHDGNLYDCHGYVEYRGPTSPYERAVIALAGPTAGRMLRGEEGDGCDTDYAYARGVFDDHGCPEMYPEAGSTPRSRFSPTGAGWKPSPTSCTGPAVPGGGPTVPSRHKPPLVQVVGEERDLLVRVEDETEAREAALAFLAGDVEAVDGTLDGYELAVRRVGFVETYRWVPSAPDDREWWRYYLHPAVPGRGAFRARLVEWGYAAKEAVGA